MSRKKQAPKTAICLYLPTDYVKTLKKLTYRQSLDQSRRISLTELITEALYQVYGPKNEPVGTAIKPATLNGPAFMQGVEYKAAVLPSPLPEGMDE